MAPAPPTPFAVFRTRFTLVVLFAFAVGWLATALREEEDWPEFSAPPEIHFGEIERPDEAAELRGVVRRPDGSPAPGTLVEILAGGFPHWTWTGPDGSFRLGHLPEGDLEAFLLAETFAPSVLPVRIGATNEPVDWTLEKLSDLVPLPPMERSSLPGHLAPSVGSSVAGCEVVLVPVRSASMTGAVPRRALADGEGDFLFEDLVQAEYELRVLPAWAEGGSWPILARAPFVHDGERELPPVTLESGRVALRAVDTKESAVAGVVVLVSEVDRTARIWPPVVSSATGSASIGDLPAGRYLVQLRAGALLAEQEVELAAGQLQRVVFEPLDLSAP